MSTFNKIKLMESLEPLPHEYRIAFAASCCERLVSNYDAFSMIEKWGEPQVLHEALEKLWAYVEGVSLSKEEINSLVTSCKGIMPDTEDFSSIFTGLAVNSVATVIYSLRSSIEADLEELAMVGNLTIESIESYLSAVNDPSIGVHSADKAFDNWLEHAPLLMAELNNQQQDIQLLKSWKGKNLDLAQALRQSSKKMGIQPFTRGIVQKK